MGRLWNQGGKAARRFLLCDGDDVVVDERRGWFEEKGKWGYEIIPGMAHKWSAEEKVEDGKVDDDGGEELSCATVGVMSCFLSLYIGILNSSLRIILEIEMIVQTDKVEWIGASIAG